jgi:DNA helicase II / ATP-dependent DNA helicase PcrA
MKDRIISGEFHPKYSVALIYRTNAQSRALEEACARYNVPFVLFGSATSFYKRQEIKDCLCYLRWLYNGRDRPSMLRAMTTPKRSIGDAAVREFDEYCTIVDNLWEGKSPGITKPSPLEILLHLSGDDSWCSWKDAEFPSPSTTMSGRSLKPLEFFSKQMRKVRDIGNVATVEQLLTGIIDEMGLIPHFDKISKSNSEFEERKDNVNELQLASQRYNDEGACIPSVSAKTEEGEFTQSPLGKFLDDVTLVSDMVDNEETSSEERFVANLMTIHASKGTEFDTVYFVGLEDGTIPTSQVRS